MSTSEVSPERSSKPLMKRSPSEVLGTTTWAKYSAVPSLHQCAGRPAWSDGQVTPWMQWKSSCAWVNRKASIEMSVAVLK